MNENTELKFKYNKGDKVLFVNRDFWTIDSVTVFERAETKMFPAYYVKLESGHITELPEEWLFADKKEAVKKIIECLEKRLADERKYCAFFQGKIDYFQSANFQMRYMGETLNMKKYRKKPVVIEAIQWNGINLEELKWFMKEKFKGTSVSETTFELQIPTLEGTMSASLGDYIIRGVKGEFYPCKPDIFEATYEPVEDEP